MKKNLSISDELKAIQAGELSCSAQKRAACVVYCKRRIKTMEALLNSDGPKTAIADYLSGIQEKIILFSKFIAWAEAQSGENV